MSGATVAALARAVEATCRRLRRICPDAPPLPYDDPAAARFVTVDMPGCTQSLPERGHAAGLARAGWRFLGVPRLLELIQGYEPVLRWDVMWLAIPPDGHPEPARWFGRKREAVAWARGLGASVPTAGEVPR